MGKESREKVCEHCGRMFEVRNIYKPNKYCSQTCSAKEAAKGNVNKLAHMHEMWDSIYVCRIRIIGKYINGREITDVRCQECGHEWGVRTTTLSDRARKGNPGCPRCRGKKKECLQCQREISWDCNDEFCDSACEREYNTKECKGCGKKIVKGFSDFCSNNCENEYEERKRLEVLEKLRVSRIEKYKQKTVTCKYCGVTFKTKYKKSHVFCSDECRKKQKNVYSQKSDKKRGKKLMENGEYDSSITLPKVYKKYKGICYICGERCNYNDCATTKEGFFIAKDKYPSIEHIIPVSKGGTHTWGNIGLACMECNSKKGNGYIESENGQLSIV